MGAHTLKLTTGIDHLDGGAGNDMFVAPKKDGKGTLGNDDVLSGGKGFDTLTAELVGSKLKPTMSGIEEALFTRAAKADVTLDLGKAKGLESLSLDHFHSDADILKAGHINALSVANAHGKDVTLAGTDPHSVKSLHLDFANVSDAAIDFHHKGGTFRTVDVVLSHSEVMLSGASDTRSMSVHSNSLLSNALLIDPVSPHNTVIRKLAIDGTAALTMLDGGKGALHGLRHVDATALTGDLVASFGGHGLKNVATGSGDDTITITELGGTAIDKAVVDLGLGDDILNLRHLSLSAETMLFDASGGNDTLRIDGVQSLDFFDVMIGFESLEIWHSKGDYHIDAGVTSLELKTVTGVNSNVHIYDATGLTRIVASSGDDQLWLEDIGGTAGDKAQLTMGDGNDNLYIYNLALDATTQFYDGGDGFDNVSITGNAQNLSTLFSDFEGLLIVGGTGTYDMAGTDFVSAWFRNATAGNVTVDHMASGNNLIFSADPTGSVTVNVENAVASTTESLKLTLTAQTTALGTAANGLHAVSLSALDIHADFSDRSVYLSELGASGDTAELTISGTHAMTISASAGADLFIDKITITDTEGVNLLHLVDGDSAFSASGIFIFGGAGNDVLIGGAGADFMTTGGGANTVYGSLGIDDVTLNTSGGTDTFIFTNKNQSSLNSGDIISDFNAFDVIDISAVVSSVAFGGNVADFNSGLAVLSTSHSVAFFDQANHMLYIDVNHDGSLSAGVDMQIELVQLSSFTSNSLIG
jgi:serralysin